MVTQGEVCLPLAILLVSMATALGQDTYLIGTGIGDVTGPAAEINMMGYGKMGQSTAGIHLRQYSRAFIFAEENRSLTNRNVFISVDVGMISINIKKGVLDRLKLAYGDLYRDDNVMITGTHTHSGVAGFHQYFLYLITSLGFVQQTYDSLVTGIVRSVHIAHASLRPGTIELTKSMLDGSNINRSPASYLKNPQAEQARYADNTDHAMLMLKLVDTTGEGIGMLNWFAVHAVSMNNTNTLISSDNKGVAQMKFEQDMNDGTLVGQGRFVAAFANSNLGDVSANMNGPKCSDTGKTCDILTSTCPGEDAQCFSSGPGKNMFESTWMIGIKQYTQAKAMWNSDKLVDVKGPVNARHQYVDMSNETVKLNDTHKVKTCKPAMGYSFAAGTTDGPGAFDFKQGDRSGNILWDIVRNVIAKPSQELIDCHSPKPILLATGEINFPYAWQPTIMELQILSIGQLVIVGVPGEFTTMSGRRMREAVKQELLASGFDRNVEVVLAGLANDYSSYVATYEEYQVQRYEGASTIFGPHTLSAYISRYSKIARSLAKLTDLDEGPSPPDLMDNQISFVPPVIMDTPPLGKKFGDVLTDVQPAYRQGELVTVTFVTGHPRNNPQLEGTFLSVERKRKKTWKIVAKDCNWDTKYIWKRTSKLFGISEAIIKWQIPANQMLGQYRIRHFGHRKELIIGRVHPFTGKSSVFRVLPAKRNSLGESTMNIGSYVMSNKTSKKNVA